jgi:hypothetical protein
VLAFGGVPGNYAKGPELFVITCSQQQQLLIGPAGLSGCLHAATGGYGEVLVM